MSTRKQYISLFANQYKALEFEDTMLSIGSEFLPPCAVSVLTNHLIEPTSEYWQWLIDQAIKTNANGLK